MSTVAQFDVDSRDVLLASVDAGIALQQRLIAEDEQIVRESMFTPAPAPKMECGECRAYEHGHCRRNPPVVISARIGLHETLWPMVLKCDWCWEFKRGTDGR